jgi:tetratricopeptide (TPR) repeat protein
MMEAWKRVILKVSEIRPLIVIIEDLHWVDQSSEVTLKYLLDSISGSRILLILTYRPEFVHTWGTKSYHNQVNLNRLSNHESLEMVNYILDVPKIEENLQDLILEKTEGIPFFIEEFIGSLKELGIIEKSDNAYHMVKDSRYITIPSTIQDVITARVDSLPDVAKKLLQIGSVIEREFSYELARKVAGIAEQELLVSLSVLRDAELLYERGVYPQSIYVFKHALTREVVYDSILETRRKALHLEVGGAIEEVYRDNLGDYYEALAGHYVTGEDYGKGAEYCRLVAGKAAAVGSLGDAIAYTEKGLSCLEKLPPKENLERSIIDFRTSLGLYYMHIGHVPETRVVEPIVDLAVKRNYRDKIPQIYTLLGCWALHVEGDYPRAFKYMGDALKIAQELNDIPSLVLVNQWLGFGLCFNCEFQKGLYHMEKALEINMRANILWAIASIKAFISLMAYAFRGKVDLAYKTAREAVSIAEESGDIFSKTIAYSFCGDCCYYKGLFEEAEEYSLKGAELGERTNNNIAGIIANLCLANIYLFKSEYKKAQEYSQNALSSAERSSYYFTNVLTIMLADCKVMNNQRDIDLNEIFKLYEENRTKRYEGYMARYIAEILLNIDDQHMNEAEEWIKKAIEADNRNSTMFSLGLDHALYAEILKRKDDLLGAKDKLEKAIEISKGCGADGWVKTFKETMVKI